MVRTEKLGRRHVEIGKHMGNPVVGGICGLAQKIAEIAVLAAFALARFRQSDFPVRFVLAHNIRTLIYCSCFDITSLEWKGPAMSSDTSRISYETFKNRQSAAYEALISLGNSATDGGLDKALAELVKLAGFPDQWLRLLPASAPEYRPQARYRPSEARSSWRPGTTRACSPSARPPRSAWAEALTRLDGAGVSDAAWSSVREHFSEEEAELLTIAIGTINTWNRIAGPFLFTPLVPAKEAV